MADYLVDKRIEGQSFEGELFPYREMESCTFINCSMKDCDLSKVKIEECTFENCDFSGAKFFSTTLQDVHFENCKLMGIDFGDVNPFLLKMSFRRSLMRFCTFRELDLTGSRFESCMLQEAEFQSCDLSNVSFDESDLERTVLIDNELKGADLSNAYNFDLDPSQNRIRGARFSLKGLPGLLTAFDIVVTDQQQ